MNQFGIPLDLQDFVPTRAAALERIARLHPQRYSRTRNSLDGSVSGLSPYITHGMVTTAEVLQRVLDKHGLSYQDKLTAELAWREFFHHVWARLGDEILADQGPAPWSGAYAQALPPDLREAATGVKAIDASIRVLYSTGYLHNHARMWLASYVVHIRKIHWRVGAEWMIAHLLDGDMACNHLSWQWVAGTFASKPYLFNADNVAKFAPAAAQGAWDSTGSAIDLSYEALDVLARSAKRLEPVTRGQGIAEPVVSSKPVLPTHFDSSALDGRTVELVHPWMLGEPDAATGDERLDASVRVGVFHLPHHALQPWSQRRWRFVQERMKAITDFQFAGDLASLKPALARSASHRSVATAYSAYAQAFAALGTQLSPEPRGFAQPSRACKSFSKFYEQVQRAQPELARGLGQSRV